MKAWHDLALSLSPSLFREPSRVKDRSVGGDDDRLVQTKL
jgi:hypothetical protein